jgi:hypothetical protein
MPLVKMSPACSLRSVVVRCFIVGLHKHKASMAANGDRLRRQRPRLFLLNIQLPRA